MTLDPTDSLYRQRLPDSETMMRFITRLIFDSFIKRVVHERCYLNPVHATLQVGRTDALLYVRGSGGTSFFSQEDTLRDWARTFIVEELFSLDSDDIDLIYLDGAVGSDSPYFHISGKGVLISSGDPNRKGTYL